MCKTSIAYALASATDGIYISTRRLLFAAILTKIENLPDFRLSRRASSKRYLKIMSAEPSRSAQDRFLRNSPAMQNYKKFSNWQRINNKFAKNLLPLVIWGGIDTTAARFSTGRSHVFSIILYQTNLTSWDFHLSDIITYLLRNLFSSGRKFFGLIWIVDWRE